MLRITQGGTESQDQKAGLNFIQGPSAPATATATRPHREALSTATAGPTVPLQGQEPLRLSGGLHLGQEGTPGQSSLQAAVARGGVRACEIFLPTLPFSFLSADTQALSQVRKRPSCRTVEMFLGTQLQGSYFHGEENKEEKPPTNYRAASENEPLSAEPQVWTQGLMSASHLANGTARKSPSQGERA